MNDELRIVQKMLGALMRHQGLLQWVDCVAFGQNDGGLYVSLFNSKAAFRVGTVYSEQFYKLPDYVQALIPQDAGEISTERARVEKRGLLVEVPGFMITRYKMNHDDAQDKWRFGDVLYVAKHAATSQPEAQPAQPTPEPQAQPEPQPELADDNPWLASVAEPPAFTGPADAIRWGVDTGVFRTYEASKSAYDRLKRIQMPGSAGEMWEKWIAHVQELAAAQVGA